MTLGLSVNSDSTAAGNAKHTAVSSSPNASEARRPMAEMQRMRATSRRPQYCDASTSIAPSMPPENICSSV